MSEAGAQAVPAPPAAAAELGKEGTETGKEAAEIGKEVVEVGKEAVEVGKEAPASAARAATQSAVHTGATLTEEAAVAIFVAKHTHTTRDSLSCKLATQYGITSKSVRGKGHQKTFNMNLFST